MNINHQRVNSTNICSVGYDPLTKILEIEFNSGGIYQYFNVPKSEYEALMSASSHGSYFHAYIKDQYACEKIR